MSILVGIKNITISYSSKYGNESDDTSKFEILKEGSHDELLDFVKKTRQDADDAETERKSLYLNSEKRGSMSWVEQDKFDAKIKQIQERVKIKKYNKLIILEGIVV